MKITLAGINEAHGISVVKFSCEYGTGTASWLGKAPSSNSPYVVELGFDETLSENSNFKPTVSTNPQIWMHGRAVHMTAVVEGVYEDTSTATLRLGDSVILIDYEGKFPSAGTWIEIKVRELKLYDIDA